MPKDAVFTMKLDTDLRDAFMAEAVKEDRPASQILRELMRGYVEERRQSEAYDAYLGQKVILARDSASRGRGRPNAEVEAHFAKRRDQAEADR